MAKFAWIEVDNWSGLYKDGKLVLENHSLHPGDLSQIVGIDYLFDEGAIDDYLFENGTLPKDINDLPGVEDGKLP